MGGDREPTEVERLALLVRQSKLKTAWYSGRRKIPADIGIGHFNYVKVGPYVEKLGGLTFPGTNQRFYKVENGELVDITTVFETRR